MPLLRRYLVLQPPFGAPRLRAVKKCAAWQISANGVKDYETPEGIRVCPALTFLRGLT